MKFWVSTAFTPLDQYIELATALDEAGLYGAMLSDHIFYPRDLKSPYPYSPYPDGRPIWAPETPWPDTWVTIGAMAAVTRRLRFGTSIYIAPARDLFTVAKLVGTAAGISGDRVSLGLGAGWMKEEFDQTGQSYENRGRRLDEMIAALRVLWGGGWVEHHGTYYDFGPLQIEPAPPRPPAIWCGGQTDAALRRAARHCDGWLGTGYTEEQADHYLTRLQKMRVEEGRADEPFEIIMSIYAPLTRDLVDRWEARGVTGMITMPWAAEAEDSRDAYKEQGKRDVDRKRDAIFRFAEQWCS
jgi:probable F420-dependent oxidoreductase